MPIVDLNRDGKPDFVALISQQFEHVVAFVNRGAGKGFRAETIFRAVVPVWGSSGIQMVDMDKDGDLDLLMSNGDSLDDFTVRPFHGVRWFENEGSYPWKQHDLAIMPGVHRAQAADMDGDGDLDVVAVAFLPNAEHPAFQLLERQGNLAPLTSLGWLEQTKPGVFVAHPLEQGKLTHTTARPRRRRRRRRRGRPDRQLRGLHVHEDRHRLQGRRRARPLGEPGEAVASVPHALEAVSRAAPGFEAALGRPRRRPRGRLQPGEERVRVVRRERAAPGRTQRRAPQRRGSALDHLAAVRHGQPRERLLEVRRRRTEVEGVLAVAAALRAVARGAALHEDAVALCLPGGEPVFPEGLLHGVLPGGGRGSTRGEGREDEQQGGHAHRSTRLRIPRRPTRSSSSG